MSEAAQSQEIDFSVDTNNLYREESITDIKVASIRRMLPVKPDGTDDPSRPPLFFGHTQLMSPEGPVPIQAKLAANNLEEAIAEFPVAMEKALAKLVEKLQAMQQQKKAQSQDDSRIIVPGR